MPSLDWAIWIVTDATTHVTGFQPRVPNTPVGAPLKAQVGDVVTWGNNTTQEHQPWPTANNDPNGAPAASNAPGTPLYFSDPIAAGGSSSPQYVVPQPPSNNVICYCCKLHPTERGQIEIF
jgi:hypothetical protein